MNFFCINRPGDNGKIIELFSKAARQREVEFIIVDPDKFSFVRGVNANPYDLLYRVRIINARQALNIEKFLLNENQFATFYKDISSGIRRYGNVFDAPLIHKKHNLPIIKTIFSLTADKELLKEYVDYLGGFPLIVKIAGGTGGVGVIKVDSFTSLISLADVITRDSRIYVMRKFIKSKNHARLIVLGDKVVASIENCVEKDDFRTGGTKVLNKKFGPEIESIGVKAVNVLGLEFGGVDILIDNDGVPYITEVNYPCYFPSAQETTGVDIAGKMVDFLIAKSQAMQSKN